MKFTNMKEHEIEVIPTDGDPSVRERTGSQHLLIIFVPSKY